MMHLRKADGASRALAAWGCYTYDFGDDWVHEICIRDIRQGEPGFGHPRFVAGERNGPPEDCGGVPGFYDVLEARADPEHDKHETA